MIFRRLLLVGLLLFTVGIGFAQLKVIFKLNSFPAKDSADKIYLVGSFNNWMPNDSRYAFQNVKGKKQLELSLPKGNYEYKFTRGSWDKGETTNKGEQVENRKLNLTSDTAIDVVIRGWNDQFNAPTTQMRKHTASSNVKIIDTAFYIPQLNRYRRIWIYLPPDYNQNRKRYPVLYMHDGQNLFDEATSYSGEWGVDEYLDAQFKSSKQSAIVVGVDNGLNFRMSEYNLWEFQNFGKGEGDQYVDFLVKTLKPFIDKNYRTLKGKANTFVAGSSMGGLISLIAVAKYPNVFGGAGIFSPAFWTAAGIDEYLRKYGPAMNSRLYFYAGGQEGEHMIPDMKKVEQIMAKVSKSIIKESLDMNAAHNEAAWRKMFPEFFEWTILKKK